MSRKVEPTPMPLTKAILDGPILSDRPGTVTTIWRDGCVMRQDQFGRVRTWPATLPVVEPVEAKKEAA